MQVKITAPLERDRTIDITMVGRRSGQRRRVEIWSHSVDGRIYLSGSPGRRDWYANLQANPDFVSHLKQSVQADLPARARRRRRDLSRPRTAGGRRGWVARGPIAEVEFPTG